jgi:predicted DNA-binding transcriptional regulator AlpA
MTTAITPRTPAGEREWLRAVEITKDYPISLSLLDKMRAEGDGPRFFQRGRVIMYRRSDVEAWVESHMSNTTGGSAT